MPKRKKQWDEGFDNLFSQANLAQMDAINQRLNEVIQERTHDNGRDTGDTGRELLQNAENRGAHGSWDRDRADRVSSGLEYARSDIEREHIGGNSQTIHKVSDIELLSTNDNTQVVQTSGANGNVGGDTQYNRTGAKLRSGTARNDGTRSLFDTISQTDERAGEYGFGNSQSSQHQSISGLYNGTGENENGQRQELSIQPTISQRESIYHVTSTGSHDDFIPSNEVIIAGAKDKYRKNFNAIKLIKKLNSITPPRHLQDKTIYATKEEQEILNGFSGWGALPQVFDPKNESWNKEYNELKQLLTDQEFAEARNSTQNSFYTPKIIIDTIYKSLDRLGLNNDDHKKEILEPSVGTGLFLGFNKQNNYHFTTIELNELTHQICQKLYPNQLNLHMGFEEYCPEKRFDAVIGNPPYSQARIYDGNFKELNGTTIHNFFAAKGIELLKDDGIMAFVTSSHFLDAKDSQTREYIAEKATFLGAVRLPNNAFKNAGTEVNTDIVIFKKGVSKELNQDWLNVKNLNDSKFYINEYFAQNPQNILGNLEIKVGRHGEELVCTEKQDLNLQDALELFVENLPKNIYKFKEQEVDRNLVYIDKNDPIYKQNETYFDSLKPNNYLKFNGAIYLKEKNYESNNKFVIRKIELNKLDEKRVSSFIQMRDTYNQLIKLEKTDIADNDPILVNTRTKLNELYDEYHKNGDFLHNSRKNRAIKQDVEAQKIISLEANYDKGVTAKEALQKGISPRNENAKKASILHTRAIRAEADIKFDNAPNGLFASMNKFGKVNIEYIAKELNQNPSDIIKELTSKDLIFLDPTKFAAGETIYEFAPKYLSGNVKEKLKVATELAKTYTELNHNVKALTAALPIDIDASDISVSMGTPWIPLKYYNQFFEKQFGISKENWQLKYNERAGVWSFTGNDYAMSEYNRKRFSYTHSNHRQSIDTFAIAEAALMRRSLRITKDSDTETVTNKNGEVVPKKVTDVEATQMANQKVENLKNLFNDWIMDDLERRNDLAKIYNDKFNCYVKKHYDGEKLEIKGLNKSYTLRKHQLDAVARAINERVCLFDHEVGAGKTLSSICSVMEQKKLGLINKPLIAVPNHLISQWESEFMNAYPDANLLVAEEKSTSPENRDEFFAKIANGEYDAILITHSQLERLPVPLKITQKVLEEQIEELRESIRLKEENQENNNGSKISVKRLESRVDNLEAKLITLLETKDKTKLLDFSDLGIDCLVVDESHMYKNLPFSTSLDKVKGLGSPAGSAKAINLFEKTTFLHENDKKVIFLTGTPVSNSLTELYAIQKYLAPDELKTQGIYSFDAWAATFAKIDTTFELDASAQKYKPVTRFSEFENLPEIANSYLNFADIVTNDDIKQYHKHYVPEVDIIKSISPRSDQVANFIGVQDINGFFNEGSIIYRMENMPDDPSEDNYLKCTSDAKKAGLDFRLIDPSAADDPKSKINNCVENIYKEYKEWEADKGTQLVFLDIGTPKSNQSSASLTIDNTQNEPQIKQEKEFANINDILSDDSIDESEIADIDSSNDTFFLYGDLYKKLVAKGIPRDEIAFIHDTNGSNSKKIELFGKVNRGDVRILIGSTAKMGAGTNVQERVTAIHHVDVPWKPSDFVQRNGRVIRQGNQLFMRDPENFKIKEFRYVTEQTYDAVSWQIIENKTKSIVNFRKGVIGGDRTLSGFDEDVASVAEMKAIATGNPLMLTHIQIKTALDKEEMLLKEFNKEKHRNEQTLDANIKKIEYLEKENEKISRAILQRDEFKSDDFKCNLYINSKDALDIMPITIPKDDTSNETRVTQEKLENTFRNNLNMLLAKDGAEVSFMDFKGFKVSGYYEKTLNAVVFELESLKTGDHLAPANLVYNQQGNNLLTQENIPYTGFLRRLNNYMNNMEESIKKNTTKAHELKANNEGLAQIISENRQYGRLNLLEALRKDEQTINIELNKMSANKEYKSNFVARSLELKDRLDKERKSGTQGVIESKIEVKNLER
ncbi:SNF2-related protein (plasmid) [Campylobacter fetus]